MHVNGERVLILKANVRVKMRAYHDYFKEPMILANSARLRSKVHICLQPSSEGWVTINSDDFVNEQDGLTACGGLIQRHDERWICGFAKEK